MLVMERLNDVTHNLKTSLTEKVVPYDQLKPNRGDNDPQWIICIGQKLLKPLQGLNMQYDHNVVTVACVRELSGVREMPLDG